MDETSREPVMVGRFLRTHAVRIVIGVVLLAAVCGVLSVYVPYQREQRIARRIEALKGAANWRYFGPNWVPRAWRKRLRFCDRIDAVALSSSKLSPDLLSELGSLTSLDRLRLNRAQLNDDGLKNLTGLTNLTTLYLGWSDVTDTGLQYLVGLTSLKRLSLDHTVITGAGLEHLKGLTRLEELDLHHTHVTDAGLEHLKGLTNLRCVLLLKTQVTAEGRARLRKALPDCSVLPEP